MTQVEVLNADGTPVPSGRRRRRRSERARRRAFVALMLVATAAVVFGAGLVFRDWVWTSINNPADGFPRVGKPGRVGTVGGPAARATRIVFPYSIVPGGVHSADEARAAAAIDPMVASHYRDVAIDALSLKQVTQPRAVYVSYRRGNEVYWTKRKLMLHPGETLLSDGKNELRGRCGNRISDEVQAPVSDFEPAAEVLDQSAPIVVPELLASRAFGNWEPVALFSSFEVSEEPSVARLLDAEPLPASPVLWLGPLSLVSERSFAGGSGSTEPVGRGPGNPAVVPEPGTLLLVAAGLAGVVLRSRCRASHKD